MLICEVEPINQVGVNLLEKEDAEAFIDEIIELPMRKACRIFRQKGIETLMSSANKNNVLQPGEQPIEKEEVKAMNQDFMSETPKFDMAGKGYAWMMLDFDSLSDENKNWLFELEQRKGRDGEPIGEKAVWFVHPCEMGNIEFDLKIGKYDYNFIRQVVPEDQIPKGIEVDPKLVEFEKRHIVLGYGGYSENSVFLRMPLNEQSTVEEVEDYFAKFAAAFKSQVKTKQNDIPQEQEER